MIPCYLRGGAIAHFFSNSTKISFFCIQQCRIIFGEVLLRIDVNRPKCPTPVPPDELDPGAQWAGVGDYEERETLVQHPRFVLCRGGSGCDSIELRAHLAFERDNLQLDDVNHYGIHLH